MHPILQTLIESTIQRFEFSASMVLLVGWTSISIGCGDTSPIVSEAPFNESRVEGEIDAFCGACHLMPSPDLFPARVWFREVERGFSLYSESGRNDLSPPAFHEVVEYYRSNAPIDYDFPDYDESPMDLPDYEMISFSPEDDARYPAISCCQFIDEPEPAVVYGDMRSGEIRKLVRSNSEYQVQLIGKVSHPAGLFPADLDQDGDLDWLVADLGNFLPAMDHLEGAIYWLDNQGDTYETKLIAENLARVADVRAADFNDDGRQDLIVAEFGWRRTGRVLLFQQQADESALSFEMSVVDARHGAIHVPVLDANGDGHMDFICLFSQEYESVELFLNDQNGQFTKQVLAEAGRPTYGSTGIEICDLDQDGDSDVIWTNGDAFDATELRPYHQIQWLENDGNWKMTRHALTVMPGAHRALPIDLDGDDDLDIIAVALLPDHLGREGELASLASTLWLEQTAPGEFTRHLLAELPIQRPTVAVGDLNGDGKKDFVTGEFQFDQTGERPADLTIWQSLRPVNLIDAQ